jgi:hypothetical protein
MLMGQQLGGVCRRIDVRNPIKPRSGPLSRRSRNTCPGLLGYLSNPNPGPRHSLPAHTLELSRRITPLRSRLRFRAGRVSRPQGQAKSRRACFARVAFAVERSFFGGAGSSLGANLPCIRAPTEQPYRLSPRNLDGIARGAAAQAPSAVQMRDPRVASPPADRTRSRDNRRSRLRCCGAAAVAPTPCPPARRTPGHHPRADAHWMVMVTVPDSVPT